MASGKLRAADCGMFAAVLVHPDSVWRVKGSSILSRPMLAILRELWQWCQREAISHCRPPFFVLSHERMVDIAAPPPRGSRLKISYRPEFAATPRDFARGRQSRTRGSRRRVAGDFAAQVPTAPTRRSSAVSANWKKSATRTRTGSALTDAHRQQGEARRSLARLGQARAGIDELAAGVVEIISEQLQTRSPLDIPFQGSSG